MRHVQKVMTFMIFCSSLCIPLAFTRGEGTLHNLFWQVCATEKGKICRYFAPEQGVHIPNSATKRVQNFQMIALLQNFNLPLQSKRRESRNLLLLEILAVLV